MSLTKAKNTVAKLPTYIDGFDFISVGGIPKGRTTLITGTAGSAKTVFAAQFLAGGIKNANEHGVFVTFEESPKDIMNNVSSLGWDFNTWCENNQLRFVDASPDPDFEVMVTGGYDFSALLARIEHAIKKINAKRVVLDSLGAIFTQFEDSSLVRNELFRISSALKNMGVTAIMTAERTDEYGDIARFGIEEFVADNVIILRNVLEAEKRRRTIEILKFRGTIHQKGEYPFTIIPDTGIIVIPLTAIELKQRSSDVRITSGNEDLDQMCGGGFFRDSVILVSGATGTGKTMMVTEFLAGGARQGERCLLFAFEESREQLIRNASGWGVDFEKLEQEGKLMIVANYPESAGLEDHLINMKKIMDDFKPGRVAVDSLSALERVSTVKGYREFVISLTSFIKHQESAGLFTSTTASLLGGQSVTEAHISSITDSIILLRYVETFGEMRRGITVLKMRGSMHEKEIREYRIDSSGMRIGDVFKNITGILSGNTKIVETKEIERMDSLFQDSNSQ